MKDIPAFPLHNHGTQTLGMHFTGMTLRDYFAAHAMSSVMPAVIAELKKTRGSIKEAIRLQDISAETCYLLADAMMKAREA
jgi:hypothetical protein